MMESRSARGERVEVRGVPEGTSTEKRHRVRITILVIKSTTQLFTSRLGSQVVGYHKPRTYDSNRLAH